MSDKHFQGLVVMIALFWFAQWCATWGWGIFLKSQNDAILKAIRETRGQ